MRNLWKRVFSLVMAVVMVMGMVPTSVFAANVNSPLKEADGVLWLYEENGEPSEEFVNIVGSLQTGFRLDDLIRKAIGKDENDQTIKVKYDGVDVGSWRIAALAEELGDAVMTSLKNRELVCFNVGGEDKWIAIRRITDVVIDEYVVISDAENVEEQIDAIFANPKAFITITNKGDVANNEKARPVIDPDSFTREEDYHWPAAGDGDVEVAGFTVTVYGDDKGSVTQDVKVVLRDSREVLTNTYVFDTPTEELGSKMLHYYKGDATPEAPALPTNEYYVCDKWVKVGNAFEPNWEVIPEYDQADGGDGLADVHQDFAVEYYDCQPEDVTADTTPVKTYKVPYGSFASEAGEAGFNPTNPDTDAYRFGYWSTESGLKPAETEVKGTVKFFPVWTLTTTPFVTYTVYDRNWDEIVDSLTLPAYQKDGQWYAQDVSTFFKPMTGYSWTVWYEDLIAFDFGKPITGNTILECLESPDVNGDGTPDGMQGDPYYAFEYYATQNGNEVELMTKTGLVKKTDGTYLDESGEVFNPLDVVLPDSFLRPGEQFNGWTQSDGVLSTDENELITYTIKCTPVIEQVVKDTVTVTGPDGAVLEMVDGKMKVSANGFVGWVEIEGLLYDEEENKFILSYNPTKAIKVTPLWKNGQALSEMSHYVAWIEINGVKYSGSYDEYNFVCVPAEANPVAVVDETTVSLNIGYAEAQKFDLKEEADTLDPGKDNYTAEEVYNAVVASPAYGEEITVKYLSRAGGPISVSITAIKELLTSKGLGDLVKIAEEMGQLPDNYTFTLSERYADFAENVTYRSADEIVSDYLSEIEDDITLPGGGLNEDLDISVIYNELKNQLENYAELHKFGQISAKSNSVTETLKITYDNGIDQYTSIDDVKVTIVENRVEPSVSVQKQEMEFDYGSVTHEELLANVIVKDAAGNRYTDLKLDANYEIKNAGEYTVTVSFEGNATLKGAKATFKLKVNKVTPSISVEKLIGKMYGEPYDPAHTPTPTVIPGDINYIHVVAGVELGELAIDPNALLKDQVLKLADTTNEIEVKAWVKLPALYIQTITGFGYELGTFKDLETIKELLGKDIESAVREKTGAIIDEILSKLPSLIKEHLGLEGAAIKLSVRFDALGSDVYPEARGIYMNMAANLPGIAGLVDALNDKVEKIPGAGGFKVTIPDAYKVYLDDANYNGAYDVGMITIAPSLPIPNDGGVQIYNDGVEDIQNVFVFEKDETFELKVRDGDKLLDDAELFYYGVTVAPNIFTKGVPTEPGLYVVGCEYFDYETNEVTGQKEYRRQGSDLVIVIIKQGKAELDIAGKTVTADGQAKLPTITVKDNDGNVINDAAYTVISGTVNTSDATSLRDLTANVNIDFPAKIDAMWQEYCETKGKDPNGTATLGEIIDYLNDCKDKVNTKVSNALTIMEQMGIPDEIPDGIELNLEATLNNGVATLKSYLATANSYYNKLIEDVQSIGGNVLNDAMNQITVSVKDLDELNYYKPGYYLFAGVITDPEYIPEGAYGLVTIRTADRYEMKDTIVCYDGEEHIIDIIDEVENEDDDIFVIVDKAQNHVTFMLDDDLTSALKALLEKSNYTPWTGGNVIVGNAYKKGDAKVEQYIDEFVTEVKAQVKAKIVAKLKPLYPGDDSKLDTAVDAAMNNLSEDLNALADNLSERLQELDQMPEDTVVIINGNYPSEIGEYEFYGYDYDVAKTNGTLTIQDHIEDEAVIENEVPATCENEGSYDEVVYCTECDKELSRTKKTTDKLRHTPGEAVRENEVPATTTSNGSYDSVVYCTVCNTEISRETHTIPALGEVDYVVTAMVNPGGYLIGYSDTPVVTYTVTKNGVTTTSHGFTFGYDVFRIEGGNEVSVTLEEALETCGVYKIVPKIVDGAPDPGVASVTYVSAELCVSNEVNLYAKPLKIKAGETPVFSADMIINVSGKQYLIDEITDEVEYTVYDSDNTSYTEDQCSTLKAGNYRIEITNYDKLQQILGDEITIKVSGAATLTVEKDLFRFWGTNVNLGNNLNMQFAFKCSEVEDWSGHYVKMVRTYSEDKDGITKPDQVTTLYYDQNHWTKNNNYFVLTYTGFAAKEMCDEITLTVYDADGNAVSYPYTKSMRQYAMDMYERAPTVIVDMLNYGAQAQDYFKYGLNEEGGLANSLLTPEQQEKASDLKTVVDNKVSDDKFYGDNLTIKSNIKFSFAFNGITDDMYAVARFTGWKNNYEEVNVPAGGFVKNNSVHVITLENMVVADSRCMIEIVVYNGDGTVYTTLHDTIESYVARNLDTHEVFSAFMKFTDSAHEYLKNN